MFCSKCGEKLIDGALFCTNCGEKVVALKSEPVPAPEPKPVPEPAPAPAPEPVKESKTAPDRNLGNNKLIIILAAVIVVLIAIIGFMMLGGKGKSSSSKETEATTAESKSESSDWERIKESGVLKVVSTTSTQYKLDLIDAICDELGLQSNIIYAEQDSRFDATLDGTADCTLSGKTCREDLENSDTIYSWPLKLVILKKNKSWLDNGDDVEANLSDKTFTFQKLSKAQSGFEGIKAWVNCSTVITSSKKNTIQTLRDGDADVAVFLKDTKLSKYKDLYVIPDYSIDFDITFDTKKDSDLIEHINEAIDKLKKDGTFDHIAEENGLFK